MHYKRHTRPCTRTAGLRALGRYCCSSTPHLEVGVLPVVYELFLGQGVHGCEDRICMVQHTAAAFKEHDTGNPLNRNILRLSTVHAEMIGHSPIPSYLSIFKCICMPTYAVKQLQQPKKGVGLPLSMFFWCSFELACMLWAYQCSSIFATCAIASMTDHDQAKHSSSTSGAQSS